MKVKITPQILNGTIDAMPSKSHAHRVLIAQKLAQLQGQKKTDFLAIPDFSQDIVATKNCLVQLDKDMPFLDCKESGSTLRFMLPVAMALKDEAVFLGSGKLPSRPISPLKEEMEVHGCCFRPGKQGKNTDKYKEICTVSGRLEPGKYFMSGDVSSQFITGLLMALPLLKEDSMLQLTTPLESAGYVDLTLKVLEDFGIQIIQSESQEGFPIYGIPGHQQYREPDGLQIEGDWSNSAFWLACGALGGQITCRGLSPSSAQRDKEMALLLKKMGAQIDVSQDTDCYCSLTCTHGTLQGIEVNVSQIPDLVPVLASVMALADGSSLILGAQRLRLKESDRLDAVCSTLSQLGADITHGGEGLSITGIPQLEGGQVDGHNDHRIVMAAAVASCLCSQPVIICGAEAVQKSYPRFFDDFRALGGQVQEI